MKKIYHFILSAVAALFVLVGSLTAAVPVKAEETTYHAITIKLGVDSSTDTAEAAKYYPTSLTAEFHERDKVHTTVILSAANDWTATYDIGKTLTDETNVDSDGFTRIYYWDLPDLKLNSMGTAEIKNGVLTNNLGVYYNRRNIHRIYNPNSGEHLFTEDSNEVKVLTGLGWHDEGVDWAYPLGGDYTPIYRLHNPNSGEHFYTKNVVEVDNLVAHGWGNEDIAFYDDAVKAKPVYRLRNPNAPKFVHHFTIDKNEYEILKKAGWIDEGIGWYASADLPKGVEEIL